MADSSKDDLARALEAFSAGNAEPVMPPASKVIRAKSFLNPTQAPAAAKAARPPQAAPVESPRPAQRPPTAATLAVTGRQLALKRTIIPLLLTLGVLFTLGGLVSLVMGQDSPIGPALTLPIVMMVLGLLLSGVTVLTMLQVKELLSSRLIDSQAKINLSSATLADYKENNG